MTDHAPVSLSRGLPETVLPDAPSDWQHGLAQAKSQPSDRRRDAVAQVAARYPRHLDAWAELANLARDATEAYAYARVGYHRGLDTLRGAGWHGTGYVRWQHESNRGFLLALEALRRSAGEIGEQEEEERCATFLRQLDPGWVSPHP
ncbi:MAG TPA: DUF3151 family protein [Acidimicrobiales bacterium]|nr:DUF3151 family protein [Acidimicrobiales bacterium]